MKTAVRQLFIVDWANVADHHQNPTNEVVSLYDYTEDTILFI
jgi:hypothetical protein